LHDHQLQPVRPRSHRRNTRRTIQAIIAGGAIAAGCVALVSAATAQATQTGQPASADRQSDFAAAAAEFHVPESVLLGVAYQESLWDAHTGGYNTSGGYGPMNLTDVTPAMVAGGEAGAAGRGDLATFAADPSLHTLTAAAKLTGLSAERLRGGGRDNIRGGAALLASYERSLTGGTSADPADWYGAVARYSASPDAKAAGTFADRVYGTLRSGARRKTAEGQLVQLTAQPAVRPATGQLGQLGLRAAKATGTECPATVDCTFLAAAPSNGQVANRPADGVDIKYIVLHDTESSYDSAIKTFQTAGSGDASQYLMRASDGAVTQMVANKDIAFHAGNYWFNMHSIGIEHEGFAAQGATWYSQTQYRATADLVKYLAARYDIPLDREHIIGHDNVPGPQDSYIAGMHWDPGPYWDWSGFMRMLGTGLRKPAHHGAAPVGSAVTITPDFASNLQSTTVCPADDPSGATPACAVKSAPSNSLYVRTAPSATAPLFGDQAVHPNAPDGGTDSIHDWGNTISDGQQFVVAGQSGTWTAIWFSGQKVWFDNPGGRNTTPATGVRIVKAAASTSVPLYGSGYPQPSEYPAGLSPSTQTPFTLYTLPAGQAYVATQPAVPTDDFFPTGDTLVTGADRLYTIQYNHRVALVSAGDVR
jgi:N-acetyl-anhydromuramyl-L-alanine amidase AmpD